MIAINSTISGFGLVPLDALAISAAAVATSAGFRPHRAEGSMPLELTLIALMCAGRLVSPISAELVDHRETQEATLYRRESALDGTALSVRGPGHVDGDRRRWRVRPPTFASLQRGGNRATSPHRKAARPFLGRGLDWPSVIRVARRGLLRAHVVLD